MALTGDPGASAPLTAVQESLLAAALENPQAVVRCASLEVLADLRRDVLEKALRALAERHDALRARWTRHGDLFEQVIDAASSIPIDEIDLGEVEDPEQAWRDALEASRKEIHPAAGPVLRALLGTGESAPRLALAASALAVDDASWHLLVSDLDTAYSAALEGADRGDSPALSFQRWLRAAQRLNEFADPLEDGGSRQLSQQWSAVSWTSREIPLSATVDPQQLEGLLAAVLKDHLSVEVQQERRGDGALPAELRGVLGQFQALRRRALDRAADRSAEGGVAGLWISAETVQVGQRFRPRSGAQPPDGFEF